MVLGSGGGGPLGGKFKSSKVDLVENQPHGVGRASRRAVLKGGSCCGGCGGQLTGGFRAGERSDSYQGLPKIKSEMKIEAGRSGAGVKGEAAAAG